MAKASPVDELPREDPQTYWKTMGLRWQVAAEPLLERMGYRILKAQHRGDQVRRDRRLQKLHKDETLDNYLWNYTDYIIARGSVIHLVDVKSKPVQQFKVRGRWETFGNESVSFTDREMIAYPAARIPVRIMLIRYRDNNDLGKLGPVYYCFVPFKQFHFEANWAGVFHRKQFGRR
jgi:hypothetical protein